MLSTRILNRNIVIMRNRKPCGCTARKTAKDMGIDKTRYRVIEYGNAAVRPDEFLKICEHYNINTIEQMKEFVNTPL